MTDLCKNLLGSRKFSIGKEKLWLFATGNVLIGIRFGNQLENWIKHATWLTANTLIQCCCYYQIKRIERLFSKNELVSNKLVETGHSNNPMITKIITLKRK
jgi:hypothetical protein